MTTEAPAADAPQQLQFTLQGDAAHCDRAAPGLRARVRYQYRALVRRYEGGGLLARIRTLARRFAPAMRAVAFEAQSADMARATASICNEEQACF